MEKKTLEQVLEELDKRYKYIAEETVYVENCKDYVCINWNSFMSSYINWHIVRCIAKYLRKYTNKPIYAASCLLDI